MTQAFAAILKRVDLDPVFVCIEAHACHVMPYAAVELDELTVTPTSGPVGTVFELRVDGAIINETGAGQVVVIVHPPHGEPIKAASYDAGMEEGAIQLGWKLVRTGRASIWRGC